MLRPGSWTEPAGGSPVPVGAGAPGSRPRFVVERRRAERGVESLFGGSKHAGRSATARESGSLVTTTTEESGRSCHGEGHVGGKDLDFDHAGGGGKRQGMTGTARSNNPDGQ